MALTLTIDGDPVTLRDADALTLGDLRAIHRPLPEDVTERGIYEQHLEILKRATGIPKTKLRKVPLRQMRQAMELVDAWAEEIKEQTEQEWEYQPTVTIRGTTYTVPEDIGSCPFGQYESLTPLLADAETEADCYCALLGVFLVPEGQEWDAGDVMDRIAAMDKAPMREALGVCRFFMRSDPPLREGIARLFLRLQMGRILRDASLMGRTLSASTDPA